MLVKFIINPYKILHCPVRRVHTLLLLLHSVFRLDQLSHAIDLHCSQFNYSVKKENHEKFN